MAKEKGEQAFNKHYLAYFGDKWPGMFAALKKKNLPITRVITGNEKNVTTIWEKSNFTTEKLDFYPNALIWPQEATFGDELPGQEFFYLQNRSSLLPVLALAVKENECVLDACAAPGGKATFLAELTKSLTVNDNSSKRMQRLKQTFETLKLPQPKIHVGNSATLFKKYPNHFDKILLDAPCSSEKHVINSPTHLKDWSAGRIRQIKTLQYSLINGLFLALKSGGRMVYSTCAINPEENEELIEKFLKKNNHCAKIIPYPKNLPGAQKNSPFAKIDFTAKKFENFDPMFIAIIEKI